MRRAIANAAALLPGSCVSLSHVLGEPGQVLRVEFGDVSAVQERLAREVMRRYRVEANAEPADVVVAGNYPWPGDPMMSFEALINHRAAGRAGGVLVGLFWTDPEEIDRSFPLGALWGIAATGRPGGWVIRPWIAVGRLGGKGAEAPEPVHVAVGARAGGGSDGAGVFAAVAGAAGAQLGAGGPV